MGETEVYMEEYQVNTTWNNVASELSLREIL